MPADAALTLIHSNDGVMLRAGQMGPGSAGGWAAWHWLREVVSVSAGFRSVADYVRPIGRLNARPRPYARRRALLLRPHAPRPAATTWR